MAQGTFITIEGNEGSGKSTQVKMLEDALLSAGHAVTILREPGSTVLSDKIRAILKDPANVICPEAELFLFLAARAQLVRDIIKPKLANGETVIADRYIDSTWVYQGWARGINLLAIEFTNHLATAGVEINKTFYLDVPLDTCIARVALRGKLDRFEQEGVTLLRKIDEGYRNLVKTYKSRIDTVDATREASVVHEELLKKTLAIINR